MKAPRDRARTGEVVERQTLLIGPVRTVLLLTVAAVLVVAAAATSSGSPVLFALAAVAVGLVLYRTATLTSDLHRARTLSVQLDEALAQVIEHRDELEAQRHELQRLALYDVVTGLGNRVLLRNRGTDLGHRAATTRPCCCWTSTGSRRSTTPWATRSGTACSARWPTG